MDSVVKTGQEEIKYAVAKAIRRQVRKKREKKEI
jgi:hypothetical protein